MIDGLLVIHVACGFASLLAGPGAMIATKGLDWHRRFGLVFFGAMAGVFATALALVLVRPSGFLFLVAIFSFYLAFTGWRAVANRGAPRAVDRAATIAMLITGAAFALVGALGTGGGGGRLGVVSIVFGGIGAAFAALDLRSARGAENAWVNSHVSRMLGAYVASVTAFSVVNLDVLPPTWRWLWPTVLGTPLITFVNVSWRRSLAGRRAVVRPGVGLTGVSSSPG